MPSPTWILFDHGQGVEVTLSLYAPPAGSNRPADAYVITECEGAFTRAARRAAEASYSLVKQVKPATAPLVVGFDLQGLQAGGNITGESGGLAMAIALAKTLLGTDPGPVAATGILAAGHAGAELTEVGGLTGKLAEAERLLPEGGWLLVPAGNAKAIEPADQARLEAKGIRVRAVANLNEALGALFPDDFVPVPGGKTKSPVDRYLGLGLALLFFLLFTTAWLIWTSTRPMELPGDLPATTDHSHAAAEPAPAGADAAIVKPAPADRQADTPSEPAKTEKPLLAAPARPDAPLKEAVEPLPAEAPKPAIPAGRGFD